MSGTRQSTVGFDLVVAIASIGGLDAFATLLRHLPGEFSTPLLLMQHRPRHEPDRLPGLLGNLTALPVRLAVPGESACQPGVTVVPGGCRVTLSHLLRFRFQDAEDDAWPGDALLTSLATHAGARAVAVVLTGKLDDGAAGVRAVKRRGGRVLVQDPATARAPGMPSGAIATGCVDFVLPPERLGSAMVALTMAPGGAALLSVPPPPWARLSA